MVTFPTRLAPCPRCQTRTSRPTGDDATARWVTLQIAVVTLVVLAVLGPGWIGDPLGRGEERREK